MLMWAASKKKRDFRALWNIKINAFLRQHNLSYSVFMAKLKNEKVELDRKVLADLAENNSEVMEQLAKQVNK